MKKRTTQQIAKIENRLVLNAQYKMTTYEQKVFLSLISKLNPKEQNTLSEIEMTISELEQILKNTGRKDGRLYEKIERTRRNLLKQTIEFPSEIEIDGKYLAGGMTFFRRIILGYNANGEKALFFLFNDILEPFLLHLNEYVQINQLQVAKMKSSHAIRIYTMLKAIRAKRRKHENVSQETYSVKQLKELLGIEKKCRDFYDFNRIVLKPSKKEINKNTDIQILEIKRIKTQRKVTDLVFVFTDQKSDDSNQLTISVSKEKTPSSKDTVSQTSKKTTKIEQKSPPKSKPRAFSTDQEQPDSDMVSLLTEAQKRSYNMLVKLGINKVFIIEKILAGIRRLGTEVKGYEDIYVRMLINHFSAKSNATGQEHQGGVFVNWWKKFLNNDEMQSKFREMLIAERRTMGEKMRYYRQIADTMKWEEYETWKVEEQKRLVLEAQEKNEQEESKASQPIVTVIKEETQEKKPFDFE